MMIRVTAAAVALSILGAWSAPAQVPDSSQQEQGARRTRLVPRFGMRFFEAPSLRDGSRHRIEGRMLSRATRIRVRDHAFLDGRLHRMLERRADSRARLEERVRAFAERQADRRSRTSRRLEDLRMERVERLDRMRRARDERMRELEQRLRAQSRYRRI